MGFDRVWICWMMACINSVSYSILLNDRTHGHIKPERGIRQGDPLSPFLFILAAEALMSCLNVAEQKGKLHGIKLSNSSPSVHHLLFADDSLLLCEASVLEAQELKKCLHLYGSASGQVINTAKSSIIFGSKILETEKTRIKQALNIDKEGGQGTYLGLPECFSGSKIKLMSFLHEKVQGRVQGWFAKALSHGGKEILIKSIGLAMPIYAMSCFKLPVNVCKKLTSVLTQFWWNNGAVGKKISWVAWERLCKSKERGGLGFHDIGHFNQSLLGKQAWRLWTNPDSLLGRIYKQRYFKNGSFLECSVGTCPSFAWRSILHGRELLKKGLVKAIGNGQDTKVWLENWLWDEYPRPPRFRQDLTLDLTMTVHELIDPITQQWNVQAIRHHFPEAEQEKILNTPIAVNRRDTLVWGYEKTGEYTSRSGYKFSDHLLEIQTPPEHRMAPLESALWQKLWKVQAPSKLKHFLWKSLAGALAVKGNLVTRGIPTDTVCPTCGHGAETICHILFTCPAAKETWELSQLPLPSAGFSTTSVFLNIHHLLECSRKRTIPEQLRLAFPWILWQIWKARNSLCFEQIRYNATDILSKALDDAVTWLAINHTLSNETVTNAIWPTVQATWSKPCTTTTKCNIGSSWDSENQVSGAAWILRDHTENALFHSRRSFANVKTIAEAELLSILWAAESMRNLHLDNIIFESSLIYARQAMLDPQYSPSTNNVSACILEVLQSLSSWSLNHCSSNANRISLKIAESVTQLHFHQSYVARQGPSWLRQLLLLDANGVQAFSN